MRTMGRLVLIWLLFALCAGGVGAENLSGFYLKGSGDKTKVFKFTNVASLEAVIAPLRQEGGDGSINEVTTLTIESGKITADDWYYFRKLARESRKGLYRLRVFHAFNAEVEMESMEDTYDYPNISSIIENFKAPKLKRLSHSLFYNTRISDLDLEGVEEIGHGVFQYSSLLKSANFPKLKTLGALAFNECQQLRVLSTPKLTTLVNEPGEIQLRDRRDGKMKKKIFEGGGTFHGCSEFSEWRLGVDFNPNGIKEDHFKGCPEGRNIILVAADGKTPLTGSALQTAVNKFKSSSGWKNGKWHGWYVGENLQPITVEVDDHRHAGVFTVPVNAAKPGARVKIFSENGGSNGAVKIQKITLQFRDGRTKEVDYINDNSFVMPNEPVKIVVNVTRSYHKVRLYFTIGGKEYEEVCEDTNMWSVVMELRKRFTGFDWDKVWRIEMLEGDMSDFTWHYMSAFPNLREMEIKSSMSYVAQPMERLFWTDYSYFYAKQIESLMLRKVERLPRYFLKERQWIQSIMLPNLKEFGPLSVFYRIPNSTHQEHASSVVMGLPGERIPDGVTNETFMDMFPYRWVGGKQYFPEKKLYLIFLDEMGNELTGDVRERAYRRYKADSRDGNPNDEFWFGWKLSYLRVRVDPTAQINGTVHIITPPNGVAEEGVPVQFEVLPKPGYGVEKVEYVVDGSSERKVLEPDSNGKYNLKMPHASITIYVKYGERKFNVVVEEGIHKGQITATPNTNVPVNTTVEVKNTPAEGYEINESELFYQRLENNLPVGDKVKIEKGSDGKYTFPMPNFSVKVFAKFKAKLWKLTHCANIEGGTLITVPPAGEVPTDGRVIVIVTPNPDWVNTSLTWKKEGQPSGTPVVNNQFTMPAANVEVCATFQAINQNLGKYAIVVAPEPHDGGEIKATPKVDLEEGHVSTITAEAKCGYIFEEGSLKYCKFGADENVESNWQNVPKVGGSYKLTMPNYTVKVRAKFAALVHAITLPHSTGVDPTSGCKVYVKTPTSSAEYKTGAMITLQVELQPGYVVKTLRWKEKDGTDWKTLNLGYPAFRMPCKDVEIDATYEQSTSNRYAIVTTPMPQEGGSITATPKENLATGQQSTITVAPACGYSFVDGSLKYCKYGADELVESNWAAVPKVGGDYKLTMPAYTVKVRAQFEAQSHTITLPFANTGVDPTSQCKVFVKSPSAPAEYKTGVEVILGTELKPGWIVKKLRWKEEGGNWNDLELGYFRFKMPCKNVEIEVEFEPTTSGRYAIVTSPEPREGGSITANPKVDLVEGQLSTITVAAQCGYRFVEGSLKYCKYGADESQESNWHPVPSNGSEYQLPMPGYTVKVRAKFDPQPQTIKLPFENTGVDPASKCKVFVKSPSLPSEYKTGSEISLQVELQAGWNVTSLRWREDNGTATWKDLNLSDPRFTMPCQAVEIDATFGRIGFEVIDLATTGGTINSSPSKSVAPGSLIIVDIAAEDGYALVTDPQDMSKRSVWWSPVDATDPAARAALEEGKTKFRVEHGYGLFTFKMPDVDVVQLGRVWVWADFTNDGNRVGFVPFEPIDGKERGKLDANRTTSVPVGFQVRVIYLRNLQNAGWALDETSVEYVEADLVDGNLVAKDGAEWTKTSGVSFQMPNSHVLVRAKIYPTGNSVFQHPELRNGRIIATPWANVPLDTDVMLRAIPDEGYEFEGPLEYTEVGQDLFHQLGINGESHNSFRMPGYSVYVRCKFKPLQYTITAEKVEGGELLPMPQKASVGSVILIDYSRNAGWDLVPGSIEWAREGTEDWVKADEGRFTMPAANVKVRAQFSRVGKEEFEITMKVNGSGVLSVFDGEFEIVSKMRVSGGTKLRVTCTPEEKWQTADLQINGSTYTEDTYVVVAPTEIVATFVEAQITSVEDARLAQVYPNPFDGTLRVEANGAHALELYTVGGVCVHRESYGEGLMHLDKLPSGVYILKVRFADGTDAVRRVVKR